MNAPGIFQEDSYAFNSFIQSLPSVLSLPGTLEESKNNNSAEIWQRSKITPKPKSEQALVHYGQTI
jgi:hypothetical protein